MCTHKLKEILSDEERDYRLILKMAEYFSGDPKRIQHFVKVYEFSKLIAQLEAVPEEVRRTLCTAAIVHDIGIKPAEEQYGRGVCTGDLQQRLGVEPAKQMLTQMGYPDDEITRVCFLVAHHHTYKNIEGLDWQILVEADFLVNAYEDNLPMANIAVFRDKIFKTKTGIRFLNDMFAAGSA